MLTLAGDWFNILQNFDRNYSEEKDVIPYTAQSRRAYRLTVTIVR